MDSTLKCPHCGKPVEISKVLKTQLEEEVLSSERKKHEEELESLKSSLEAKIKAKTEEELKIKFEDAENEKKELKDQNRTLQEQLLELNKTLRAMRQKDEEREIEMQKKLAAEEDKIRAEALKKAEEDQHTKILEKDKQLADAMKEVEEMRRKLQQGSQQAQGEVFELEFEKLLRTEFPNDQISEVAKGTRGGDIIQEVWDRNGNYCGKILWELKNTKTWQEPWVDKLKADQRAITAEFAVIISEVVPTGVDSAKFYNNIWVTKRNFVIGLACSLRVNLIQVAAAKRALEGKKEKTDILYSYLSGTEFRHRVEAIVEAFTNMQTEIEKEKRYFVNKWSRDEKNIRQVIDNTYGMHGDLKGIMGNVLPQIKGLDDVSELSDGVESIDDASKVKLL